MSTEHNELYTEAIEKWGKIPQMEMIVEECAELIQAIQKFKRKPLDEKVFEHVCEEIADVTIMIEQARIIFDKLAIERNKDVKLERLKLRLSKSEGPKKFINIAPVLSADAGHVWTSYGHTNYRCLAHPELVIGREMVMDTRWFKQKENE